ncbi:MAG: ParB/RepB/Spo0J family partition protein [Cyanobacteriota bacterium]|nr:ParB/RepB/Spo0J family partition protein [Cyanobacteriota bacterium]
MSRKKPSPFSFESTVRSFVSETSAEKKDFLMVALDVVVMPERQPRCYFDAEAMDKLVASIREHGILSPLVVRPTADDRYELVAGERRYRAARTLGLEKVPVVVRQLTDQEAGEVALLENLQREDLNPVEETEGVLALLSQKLNQSREQAIALLQKAAHPDRNSVNNVIHSREWETVEETFARIGSLTPSSFRSNRLPLLNLPEDVLDAVRRGQIEYTKARVIARVKDASQRQELLAAAIADDLSLSAIQKQVKQINPPRSRKSSKKALVFEKRIDTVCERIKKAQVWKDTEKEKQLEALLGALEELLDNGKKKKS